MIRMRSDRPGAWERHYRRRQDNPLFPAAGRDTGAEGLVVARAKDSDERAAFEARLVALVTEATELAPNEGSERLLALKSQLERAYAECASLAGDQRRQRDALARLIELIANAVRSAAGPDPQAQRELDAEAEARRIHFRLLEQPLVADLMRPDSPIAAAELVPTLLSESEEALAAALWLFGPPQLDELCRRGRDLLTRCFEAGAAPPAAWARLRQMEAQRAAAGRDDGLN